jgi:hypothetical protein
VSAASRLRSQLEEAVVVDHRRDPRLVHREQHSPRTGASAGALSRGLSQSLADAQGDVVRLVEASGAVRSPRDASEHEPVECLDDLPVVLTVTEAAHVLRIGRSLAYQLAQRYEDSGGREGLPVVRLGSCLRVPRAALIDLITTGTLIQLAGPPAR